MNFTNHEELLAAILGKYYNVKIELSRKQNFNNRPRPEEIYYRLDIKDPKQNYHRLGYYIYYNNYFRCCGLCNMSGYSIVLGSNHKIPKISYALPLLMIIFAKYSCHGAISLTVPYQYMISGMNQIETQYIKANRIADKLLTVLGGSKTPFFNPNTKRDVYHYTILTEKLENVRLLLTSFYYVPSGQVLQEEHIKANVLTFDNLFQEISTILDQL